MTDQKICEHKIEFVRYDYLFGRDIYQCSKCGAAPDPKTCNHQYECVNHGNIAYKVYYTDHRCKICGDTKSKDVSTIDD